MPPHVLDSLQQRLRGELLRDPVSLGLFATDASLYEILPSVVARPRDAEDVVTIVNFAKEHAVPLIPRGAGTSLSGQSIGPGIVLDFGRHMHQLVSIEPAQRTARVQPGLVLEDLNRAAAKYALQFGPDVATINRATLGGMIGNNSAGSRSILYGKTVDHVLELQCVLGSGELATLKYRANDSCSNEQLNPFHQRLLEESPAIATRLRTEILEHFPAILRRVSGYNLDEFVPEFMNKLPLPKLVQTLRAMQPPEQGIDLTKLIVGAEGTLGIVTEALVHLVPLPSARGVMVLQFASLDDAVETVGKLLPLEPSAIELFDGLIVEMARRNLEYRRYLDFVEGNPASLLIVEASGEAQEVHEKLAAMRALSLQGRATRARVAETAREADHIWACRKAALPLLMSVPGNRKPIAFVEDTAVSPERIAEFVRDFRQVLDQEGVEGAYYGHASVGCLHIRPLLDVRTQEDRDRLARISSAIAGIVLKHRGAMSGEHGDGLARSYLNERLFGRAIYQGFRELKRLFDPDGIFNPGKVVDGPSPTENLRGDARYELAPLGENVAKAGRLGSHKAERGMPSAKQPAPHAEISTQLDFSSSGGLLGAAALCNGAGVCRKLNSGVMCPSYMATREEEHSTRGRANALRLMLTGALPATALTGNRLHETFSLCLQCKGCKAECPSNVDVGKMKVELLAQQNAAMGLPWRSWFLGNAGRWNRWGSSLASVLGEAVNHPILGGLASRALGLDLRRPLPRFERFHFRRWFDQRKLDQGKSSQASSPKPQVALLDDCLNTYLEPRTPRAAVLLLEAAGFQVQRLGLACCGRTHLSQGMVDDARLLAKENAGVLSKYVRQGIPILSCEPSCLFMLRDEYQEFLQPDVWRGIAGASHLVEDFLVETGAWAKLSIPAGRSPVLFHGHCHQKALHGLAASSQFCGTLSERGVQVLDAGCCGMAGAFGYQHYEVSMAIGNRVLFPAVHSQPEAVVLAPGFSCRAQIKHGTGRTALHPVEFALQRMESPSLSGVKKQSDC